MKMNLGHLSVIKLDCDLKANKQNKTKKMKIEFRHFQMSITKLKKLNQSIFSLYDFK